MKISVEELKKESRNFRIISSRLMRSDYWEAISNRRRFVTFLDNSPLISGFIAENTKQTFDVEPALQRQWNERIAVPESPEDEIAFVYQLLKYAVENQVDYQTLSHGYSAGSRYFDDWVSSFHHNVVFPFIQHIEQYFHEILIDHGYDNSQSVNFRFDGPVGQFNYAQNRSVIHATQTTGTSNDIDQSIEKLLSLLDRDQTLPVDKKEDITDMVEAVQAEVNKPQPKRGVLKGLGTGLKAAVELLKDTETIKDGVSEVISWIDSIM